MPRKLSFTPDKLLEVLIGEKCALQSDGSVAQPSAEVWINVSRMLEGNISPKYVYVFVRENRYGILDQLREANGLHNNNCKDKTGDERLKNQPFSSDEEDMEDEMACGSDTNNNSEDDNDDDYQCESFSGRKEFITIINSEEWKEIYHGRQTYKRQERFGVRNYYILKPKMWTSILINCLWQQHGIPCAFSFKRAKIYKNQADRKYFLLVKGRCSECGSQLTGVSFNEPEENESLQLSIYANDTRNVAHSKKCRLSGFNRKKVAEALRCHVASVFRRHEANKLMKLGDPEPPHLYSTNVLRKAKQELRDANIGCVKADDPLRSLQIMKHTPPYAGAIHDIAIDKVNVQYWSPSQMYAYKKYCSEKGSTLCIDATGSLVKKISRPNGSSGPIFLYECVIKTEQFQIPVSQMISEKHDANTILYWLNEWIRCGAPIPSEVITDGSRALVAAVAKSFGKSFSLQEYKQKCFSYIMGNQDMKPSSFIRSDIAHIVKRVCSWSYFRGKNKRIKDFYVRCFVLHTKCKSINSLAGVFEMTLTVALSETDGMLKEKDAIESPAEKCRSHLFDLIGDIEIPSDINLSDTTAGNNTTWEEEIRENESAVNIRTWLRDIKEKAEMNSNLEGNRVNAYFCKSFAKDLMRMMDDFPLWTAVMVPLMECTNDVASSAIVEGDFADIKIRILKHETRPLTIDKMIGIHLQSIEGSVKIAVAPKRIPSLKEKYQNDKFKDHVPHKINSLPDNNNSTESDETCIYEPEIQELHYTENWRNMVKPLKKRKVRYMDPFPEVKAAHNLQIRKIPVNILLKNGNISGSIKINKIVFQLNNTCPFDSLCQSLLIGYIEHEIYRNDIKIINAMHSNIKTIFHVVESIAFSGITSKVYEERCEVLSQIIEPIIHKSDLRILKCQDNISNLAGKLLSNDLCVVQKLHCTEANCHGKKHNIMHKQPVTVIDYKLFLAEGLQAAVQKAFDEDSYKCKPPCPGFLKTKRIPKSHLLLDIEFLGTQIKNHHFKLNQFPVNLSASGVDYKLVSIIAFIPSTPIGHYVAYCRRGCKNWEVYNDLSPSVIKTSDETELIPHMCYYVRSI